MPAALTGKIFINRLGDHPPALNQRLRIVARAKRPAMCLTRGRQAVAKPCQPLLTEQKFAVGKFAKHLL